MKPPVGLFVQISTLPGKDEVREWLARIVKDFRQKGSPYYMETLTIDPIAAKKKITDPNTGNTTEEIVFLEDRLDWIKDYWPHFDYLFVGCISPDDVTIENPDIKNSYYRSAHINATKYWANKFIQYLRTNNITIPIHWYINWEVDLSSFADSDGSAIKNAFKDHFLQLTDVLTGISHDNGLNEPEFFWSPYFDNVQLLPEVAEIH